jgi:PAS domain-containing protein
MEGAGSRTTRRGRQASRSVRTRPRCESNAVSRQTPEVIAERLRRDREDWKRRALVLGEQIPAAVLVVRDDGRVLLCNSLAAALLGKAKEDLLQAQLNRQELARLLGLGLPRISEEGTRGIRKRIERIDGCLPGTGATAYVFRPAEW